MATKTQEHITGSSRDSEFNSKQPDHSKKPKKRSKPIKRVKQSVDSNNETFCSQRKPPITTRGSRKMGDHQIRQFCNMFCDLCTTAEFKNFADAIAHYRECHGMQGYLVCCNLNITRRGRLLDHLRTHVNPDAFRYATICRILDHLM